MKLPDLSEPFCFFIATLVVFAVVIGRYFLIAGIFYYVFYKRSPVKWKKRKISDREYKEGQFRKEVGWSMVTAFIFALAGAAMALLWQKGYTKIYVDVDDYSIW